MEKKVLAVLGSPPYEQHSFDRLEKAVKCFKRGSYSCILTTGTEKEQEWSEKVLRGYYGIDSVKPTHPSYSTTGNLERIREHLKEKGVREVDIVTSY